jgi:hypothetical protein
MPIPDYRPPQSPRESVSSSNTSLVSSQDSIFGALSRTGSLQRSTDDVRTATPTSQHSPRVAALLASGSPRDSNDDKASNVAVGGDALDAPKRRRRRKPAALSSSSGKAASARRNSTSVDRKSSDTDVVDDNANDDETTTDAGDVASDADSDVHNAAGAELEPATLRRRSMPTTSTSAASSSGSKMPHTTLATTQADIEHDDELTLPGDQSAYQLASCADSTSVGSDAVSSEAAVARRHSSELMPLRASPLRSSPERHASEKASTRRKQAKMEQVFGQRPSSFLVSPIPAGMYIYT